MTAPLDAVHTHAARRPGRAGVPSEILQGLLAERKTLPPKLFYDATGAELFERICEQPEYYPTRTELAILHASADEIAELAGPRCALIEYGSGAGVKVRLLLDALESPVAYVPIDISREQLRRVSNELAAEYPGVSILPIAADYTQPIELPALPAGARRLAFFPGSTIGNFHPTEAAAFLSRIRRTLGSAGALVLGVDRRKDASVLDRAYDDSAGVTAAFNRNVLTRLNREYGATFDVGSFSHRAFFNETASRVEMHLVSLADQTATLGDRTIRFERGETIWTESSYKYDARRLEELVAEAGFRIERLWTDPRDLFWVALLSVG